MKITVEGVVYDYDNDKLMMSELFLIQDQTGLKLRGWQAGLQEMDAAAVKALVFLLKKRAGESPDWSTLDFDINSLDFAQDAPPPEAAASPTEAEVVNSPDSEIATSA